MTDKIKNTIETIENRDSIMDYCESRQLSDALDLAIHSLKAWSEVLNELEKKDSLYLSYLNNKENPYDSELFGKHIAVSNCIDTIKQKLAEIEEVK